MTDVFISYSRKDKAFVQILHRALEQSQYDAWVDWQDIPPTADWWAEIEAGIEASDTFLFVISPDSIHSEVCNQEISHAVEHNKRLVPILHHEGFDMDRVHPTLGKANWLFFREQDDFDNAFSSLVKTLDTDLDHVKAHTRLLVRAVEWEQKNKIEDLLLRGSDVELAISWLQDAVVATKQPTPTALQVAFIHASQALRDRLQTQERERQQRELRRTRRFAVGAVGVGIVMAALALFAINQKRQVEIVQESQINALSRYSLSLTHSGKTFDGLLEALRAGQQLRRQLNRVSQATHSNVLTALQASVYEKGWREHNRLSGHTNDVNRIAISPDGTTIASASRDQTIRLWDMQGNLMHTLRGHKRSVTSVAFSPDAQTLASTSADQTVKLWHHDGRLLNSFQLDAETKDVAFHPDGEMLAIASYQRVVLVSLDGDIIRRIPHEDWVNSVEFSADGDSILTSTRQATQRWTLAGERVQSFPDKDWVNMARFRPVHDSSQNGQETLIASAGYRTVHLWTLQGEKLRTLPHGGWVNSIRFSPDGTQVVTADSAKQVTLWDLEQNTAQVFPQDRDMVDAVFSPDGKTLVFASRDNTIRVWRRGQEVLDTSLYRGKVSQLQFNADGNSVATMTDSLLQLWNTEGELVRSFRFEQPLNDFSFGPQQTDSGETQREMLAIASGHHVHLQTLDGRVFQIMDYPFQVTSVDVNETGDMLLISSDSDVYLVSLEGDTIKTMSETSLADSSASPFSEIHDARFDPTGQHVAVKTHGNVLYLWNLARNQITTLTHDDTIHDFSFSPSGMAPSASSTEMAPLLVSGSDDNTLRLWTLDGTLQHTLYNETAFIHVRFSPDGTLLAAVDADNSINLWTMNHDELQPVISLVGHTGLINAIEFNPDSTYLVSADAHEHVIAWNLSDLWLDELMANACQIVEDYMATNQVTGQGNQHLCDNVTTS